MADDHRKDRVEEPAGIPHTGSHRISCGPDPGIRRRLCATTIDARLGIGDCRRNPPVPEGVYLQSMVRLPKAALLVFLLALSGVPGVALQLCAQSAGSPTHACCMGHEQMFDAAGGSSTAQAKTASCCKVTPQ